MYQTERFELRLTAQDLALLDQKRGTKTRSGFVRDLIRAADEYHRKPALDGAYGTKLAVVPQPEEPDAPEEDRGSTSGGTPDPAPDEPANTDETEPAAHHHRRGQRLDPPRWVRGQARYSFRCKEPGCDHILEDQ